MTGTRMPAHRRRARLISAGAIIAVITTAATACSAAKAADDPGQAGTVQAKVQTSIAWGACPAVTPGITRNPDEKCGTVTVPLNYQQPNGKTITIEVSEIATAKPGRQRGYLLVNPGGPGLQGLDTPSTMAEELPAPVLDEYNLIGFDPRGVGYSTPMSCGLNASFLDLLPYPAADGSIKQNVTVARSVASACAKIGNELQYFTTANTARDINRIRLALGVSKISYWGQSYGTYLGAVYATLFPQNTGRIVLEGTVGPDDAWQREMQLWDQGMNDRFPDAAKIAAANNAELGLGSTVAQVTSTFIALASQLDRKPATVPGTPAALSGAILRATTYELLLHNTTLTALTEFWKAAADLAEGKTLTATDAAVLQQVFASSPAQPGVPADNQVTMTWALFCGDASWSRNVASYAAAVATARAQYPLSAGMPDNITPCAFWPKPVQPPVKVTSRGPRNILILQNRRDNATPWAGALDMYQALGSRAGFVGVDNGGHYVYDVGDTCADQATDAFLTKGTLPAKPIYCPAPTAA
jgi:pimeloyl-ACP methyl ester carboxylesterase